MAIDSIKKNCSELIKNCIIKQYVILNTFKLIKNFESVFGV